MLRGNYASGSVGRLTGFVGMHVRIGTWFLSFTVITTTLQSVTLWAGSAWLLQLATVGVLKSLTWEAGCVLCSTLAFLPVYSTGQVLCLRLSFLLSLMTQSLDRG